MASLVESGTVLYSGPGAVIKRGKKGMDKIQLKKLRQLEKSLSKKWQLVT